MRKRPGSDRLRLIVVQTRPVLGDPERNVRRALLLLDRALGEGGADLAVLPELFHSGYAFRSKDQARALSEDPRRGPTRTALAHFAAARRLTIVAGLNERAGRVLHNSAIWVGPDGKGGVYRKVHLFDTEKKWFEPGRDPWPVFRCGPARVGVLICFDWRF